MWYCDHPGQPIDQPFLSATDQTNDLIDQRCRLVSRSIVEDNSFDLARAFRALVRIGETIP